MSSPPPPCLPPAALAAVLLKSLVNDNAERQRGEQALSIASTQPGFAAGLTEVAFDASVSLPLRQMAAVLLKQFAKKHWSSDMGIRVCFLS